MEVSSLQELTNIGVLEETTNNQHRRSVLIVAMERQENPGLGLFLMRALFPYPYTII